MRRAVAAAVAFEKQEKFVRKIAMRLSYYEGMWYNNRHGLYWGSVT